ncbi:hypothetical protein PG984_002946 [Apiospora sp. TS-2023a]
MRRSARGRDACDAKGLRSAQTDLTESRARHGGQEDKPKRESLRRSRAKRYDAPKDEHGDVGVKGGFLTPAATRPGTMSVIPIPASAKRRNQNISTTAASKSAKSAFGDDGDDTESMAPVSVRDLPITKVPELEGTPRTESRYGPLGPVIPELHDQPRPSELR